MRVAGALLHVFRVRSVGYRAAADANAARSQQSPREPWSTSSGETPPSRPSRTHEPVPGSNGLRGGTAAACGPCTAVDHTVVMWRTYPRVKAVLESWTGGGSGGAGRCTASRDVSSP